MLGLSRLAILHREASTSFLWQAAAPAIATPKGHRTQARVRERTAEREQALLAGHLEPARTALEEERAAAERREVRGRLGCGCVAGPIRWSGAPGRAL